MYPSKIWPNWFPGINSSPRSDSSWRLNWEWSSRSESVSFNRDRRLSHVRAFGPLWIVVTQKVTEPGSSGRSIATFISPICLMAESKRRYRVCPIIHCCNSTTPYWITAPPILFYMVPCKEGHLCACNILGKHQPLVKRNISFESYEWALFIKVNLFTNGSGCPGTIVLWRCQKVMRTN